jgi:hypothetical protein
MFFHRPNNIPEKGIHIFLKIKNIKKKLLLALLRRQTWRDLLLIMDIFVRCFGRSNR